jgi:undecaprenyl diphosphate synthase
MVRSPPPLRIPRHVGFIPDGNRRWAQGRGLAKQAGYEAGIEPGLRMLDACRAHGIEEVSIYGFTKENARRPRPQVEGFRRACVAFGRRALEEGAALFVVGDTSSPVFPDPLRAFARERARGDLRVNLLVNYSWQWDVETGVRAREPAGAAGLGSLASGGIPRIELVVRWGGRRRLSGFLPLQCAYADVCVLDALWPEATAEDLGEALAWYQTQDVTMGG